MQKEKPHFTGLFQALEIAYSHNNVEQPIVSKGDGTLYVAFRQRSRTANKDQHQYYSWSLVNANDSNRKEINLSDFLDKDPNIIGIFTFTNIGHVGDV